jgi:hypothetical protein
MITDQLTFGTWSLEELGLAQPPIVESFQSLSPLSPSSSNAYEQCTPPVQMSLPCSPWAVHESAATPPSQVTKRCLPFVVDNTESEQPLHKKQTKQRLGWKLEQSLGCAEEMQALEFLKENLAQPGFPLSKNQPYSTTKSVVQCYKCCGKNKYGCAFKAKVEYHCDSIEIYSSGAHHHANELCSTGVPYHLKPIMEEAVRDGFEAARLHRKLVVRHKVKISLKVVQGYVSRMKKFFFSTLVGNTIGDLHGWCANNELTPDSGKHRIGVLKGWRANGPDNVDAVAADIVFLLTTRNLLQNAKRQSRASLVSFVDIDQTYKLLENGFPVTVLGTVNTNHEFRLIGIGISRHENEDHLTRLFPTNAFLFLS